MNKHPPLYLEVAIPSPLAHSFHYLPPLDSDPTQLKPGIRLKVPFGHREIVGFLLEVVTTSPIPLEKLKYAAALLDQEPLISPALLKLYRWTSEYYHVPLGTVIATALPPLLRKGRSSEASFPKEKEIPVLSDRPVLNEHQKNAIEHITATEQFQTFLLWGVTGSGKTEVYLRCVEKIIQNNQQILILIPEIGLTPQTLHRFRERFSAPTVILHSNISAKKRMQSWLMAKSGHAKIIIGTRSAIFTPLPHLGMIIVDEEHDASFKQHSGFRYSARDLAVLRGTFEKIPVILGSATPSLETLYNANRGRYQCLSLPTRAGLAHLPTIHLLDIRQQKLVSGISSTLLEAISTQLKAGGQVLLFLNRRGYASTLLCHACGWIMHCDHCDAHLTLHYRAHRLYCHHCGAHKKIALLCLECKQSELIPLGLGTERLEISLQKHFPDYRIIRIDRDNIRRKSHMAEKIAEIQDLKAHILIGTQMIAKGHHFPHLTLVAIVDGDSGLYGSDFRATEKMGQLLQQVAGRAGREAKAGTVIIQTHHPEHPLWQTLIQQGYHSFATALLKERKTARLPPFTYIALLQSQSVQEQAAADFLTKAKEFVLTECSSVLELLGPIPATMTKKAGYYRYQLLLQSPKRSTLQHTLKQLTSFLSLSPTRSVRWSLDVDPQEV